MSSQNQNVELVRCFCGIAKRNTSWTDSNVGRRFWGYERYRGILDNGCGFFHWYDLPICARSKKVIPGLLQRIWDLESRLEDGMNSELNGFLYSGVSSGRVLVEDKAISRLGFVKKIRMNFFWFFLGFLCLLVGLFLGKLM